MLWIWTRRPQEWHLVTRQGYVTSVCPFTPNLDHLAKGLSVRFLCNKGTNFSFVINIYFAGYTWDCRCAVSLYTYFSKHWQILTAVIITTAFLWWFWISLIPSLFTNWNSSCPFSPIYFFIHLFLLMWTQGYFILWLITQHHRDLFSCSNSSCFGHRKFFQVVSHAHLTCLSSSDDDWTLPYFLYVTSCSILTLYFLCPSHEINHFSKEPCFFLLENAI